jgi:hypothetical protein
MLIAIINTPTKHRTTGSITARPKNPIRLILAACSGERDTSFIQSITITHTINASRTIAVISATTSCIRLLMHYYIAQRGAIASKSA